MPIRKPLYWRVALFLFLKLINLLLALVMINYSLTASFQLPITLFLFATFALFIPASFRAVVTFAISPYKHFDLYMEVPIKRGSFYNRKKVKIMVDNHVFRLG